MAQQLTIRNLTPGLISFKSLETFEDPNSRQSKSTAFPGGTTSAPSAPTLGEHAQTFNHEDLDVPLEPFESYTVRVRKPLVTENASSAISSTMLRLTIESSEGERYRIDTNPTYTQKTSRMLTPLTPNPSASYTALYHPAKPVPHLTFHTNHSLDYSRWMELLPPTLPLSAISIPGTHNSHTHYRALPSVRCQVVPIAAQLENGIRFLDIRVQPSHATDTTKKDLYLVHGAFPISLTGPKYLGPVFAACYAFLDAHPSETILLSLKREGVGAADDQHLARILQKHYIGPNADKWYTASEIPYLGAVRGKLVLIRRYDAPEGPDDDGDDDDDAAARAAPGLDATAWPHNSTHALHGPFCVQDWCEVMHPASIATKLQYSNEHLVRAAQATAFIPGVNTDVAHPLPPGPLFLNFLSGSNFWRVGTWPERIARVVNSGIEEWICMGHGLEKPAVTPREPGRASVESVGGEGVMRKAREGDGCTGVVIMDMVGDGGDWDLVRMIIGMNMGLRLKMQESARQSGS